MSLSFSLEDIRRLPMADRIRLVGDIWDSIAASEDEVPLSDAQREELQRRLETYRRDPRAGKTWEDVKKSLD
jgi:putative addiction module component (TIGR02574 family)